MTDNQYMISIGLAAAFIGYAFTNIVMEDVLYKYAQLLHKLPHWLGKPLGLCSVCFTGQLALWTMLPYVTFNYIGIIIYLAMVSLAMIIAKFLTENL